MKENRPPAFSPQSTKSSRFVVTSKTTYSPIRLKKQITKVCKNFRSK